MGGMKIVQKSLNDKTKVVLVIFQLIYKLIGGVVYSSESQTNKTNFSFLASML